MSIATELENYETYLTAAYNKCAEKNATIPQNKNLQNLADCIDSIKDKYTLLAYLESTGTQYVKTSVYPYKTTTEIKFQLPSTSFSSTWHYFAGCWNDNNNRYYVGSTTTNNGFAAQDRSGTQIILQNSIDTNTHTLIYNGTSNRVYWDGTQKGTVSDLTAQSARPISVFCRDDLEGTPIPLRIYYVKITDRTTGTLLAHLVPVLDNNNVACMYDKVSDTFLYNQGTGTFRY